MKKKYIVVIAWQLNTCAIEFKSLVIQLLFIVEGDYDCQNMLDDQEKNNDEE